MGRLQGRARPALRCQVDDRDGPQVVGERSDEATCESAATIAEMIGVRTLDALHLAAAQRISAPGVGFLTFDVRQTQAARALGLTVLTA